MIGLISIYSYFSEVSRTGKYQDQYMHCYKECTLENVQL